MPRRRLEERDLRSLERRSMYSIFRALDPKEGPSRDSRRKLSGLYVDEFSWKHLVGVLWIPALLALIQIEIWLQLPPLGALAAIVAFCFAYLVVVLLVLRKS